MNIFFVWLGKKNAGPGVENIKFANASAHAPWQLQGIREEKWGLDGAILSHIMEISCCRHVMEISQGKTIVRSSSVLDARCQVKQTE